MTATHLTREGVRLVRSARNQLSDIHLHVRPACLDAEANPSEHNGKTEEQESTVVAEATQDHERDSRDRDPFPVSVELIPSRR